jgi:small subunit ribosomal protein S9
MIEKSKKVATSTQAKKAAHMAHGIGRRKSSVARVWLRRGKGSIEVNGKDLIQYFDTELTKQDATAAFRLAPNASHYDLQVNVSGGGLVSQAGAVRLGIARALLANEEELRSLFRQNGLLTVDSRLKERKKYGRKAARRGFQFVKR